MTNIDDDEIDEMIQNALMEEVRSSKDRNLSFRPLEDAPKAQLVVNRRLIFEIEELRQSLEQYKKHSQLMTGAMIFLSLVLVILGIIEVLTVLGIFG